MKLEEAVAKSLTGDGVLTGRDEQGLFVRYDAIEIQVGEAGRQSVVRLLHQGVHVHTPETSGNVMVGMTLTIDGVDGRLRLTL